MSGNSDKIHLRNLIVYNSLFGPKEGELGNPIFRDTVFVYPLFFANKNDAKEHKKILYFHPSETDIDTQIRTVGLCEAVIKFTQTFNPSKPCEVMHTQKTKLFFLQPEQDFWIIMTIAVPNSVVAECSEPRMEYHGDNVEDNIYLSILRTSYLMFRFFQGTFKFILIRFDIHWVQQRLTYFYSRYLLNLRLDKADLSDVFSGIYFLPLDKIYFLKVQCFVNLVEAAFTQVKYIAVLYNDKLVWSGLEQEDMHILYRYIVCSLFPSYMESELQLGPLTPTKSNLPSFSQAHYGRFITGPPNINDASTIGKVPKAHISVATGDEDYHLLVYRALSASICLLIKSSFQLSMEFFKKLDNFLGPQLTSLSSDIFSVISKKTNSSSVEPQFKYMYFNHMNLAQKSTMKIACKYSFNDVPASIMRLLADANCDLRRIHKVGEIFMKLVSGCWVIGKVSDQRELYIFISERNANLLDINEEVQRLCTTHFENIFSID